MSRGMRKRIADAREATFEPSLLSGDELAVLLTPDEVLVLAEWCQRQEEQGDYAGMVEHDGERHALYALHCALEPLLVVPGDYMQTWREALDRLTPED